MQNLTGDVLKVSVIIPVFNGERFIREAIQSVMDQTYPPLEIIVVDDGSSDKTADIVRHLSGARPILYRRQSNQGAAAARNAGVSLAQGEWIAFLDADDVWYPEKLAIQVEHFKTYPDVPFFYSDMDIIDDEGKVRQQAFLTEVLRQRRERAKKDLVSIIFGDRPFPYPSTVVLRKDVFTQSGGFDPAFELNDHEDFDLFARVALAAPIHFIDQSLVKYRRHAAQTLVARTENRKKNFFKLLGGLWQIWTPEPEKQILLLQHYMHLYSHRARECLKRGDYKKAQEYYWLAFRYYPWSWHNLRRWALSFLPGLRQIYSYRVKRRLRRLQETSKSDLR